MTEFTPPKAFRAPTSDSADGSFDLVCTFKPCGGGKVCMTKMGDYPMPDSDEQSESQRPYEQKAREMTQAMPDSLAGSMAGNQEM